MEEGVNTQATASPEKENSQNMISERARENFERLERAKDEARERAAKAEMEAALLKQRLEMLEQRNAPKEVDPLDNVQDYVDPVNLKAALDQREKRFKKEAEEIAEKKFREWKNEEHKQNHEERLRRNYPDYSQVMTEENVVNLEKTNPQFVKALLHIKDDYERKELAYNYFKENQKPKEPPKSSIKEKVEENARNPYFIPAGSGTPGAVDYDLKSPQARQDAYAKLKAAQRRPIGGGSSQQ